jgi:hypothetical protein
VHGLKKENVILENVGLIILKKNMDWESIVSNQVGVVVKFETAHCKACVESSEAWNRTKMDLDLFTFVNVDVRLLDPELMEDLGLYGKRLPYFMMFRGGQSIKLADDQAGVHDSGDLNTLRDALFKMVS